MALWRIKINSEHPDVTDWDGARRYCRERGLVGVGWGLKDVLDDGAAYDEVLEAVAEVPGWSPGGPNTISRLAEQVQVGELIWTRDRGGAFWLGRIEEGTWRYDGSPEAYEWDLNNVRPCRWLSDSLRDYEVPGAVVRGFSGRGQTLCRVPSLVAERVSRLIWDSETNPDVPWEVFSADEVISDLLEAEDVEDAVLLLLQAEGWLLLPSTRKKATPMYEAAFRHRDDGRHAVVSVKSGSGNPVPVPELCAEVDDTEVFVFSTHDNYSAKPEDLGAKAISRARLAEFMATRPELLPDRVSRWLRAERG